MAYCSVVFTLLWLFSIRFSHESSSYNGWGWHWPPSAIPLNKKQCEVTLSASNTTTYNLCPLQLVKESQIKYYRVYDIRLKKTFAFNIGAETLEIPSEHCGNETKTSYAYLYDTSTEFCIPLSSSNGGPVMASLIHEPNPSEGIVLTYYGGSIPSNSNCSGNTRRLNIKFVCDNDQIVDIPNTIISDVDYYGDNPDNVDNQCQYNLTFNSIYGCPHSCAIYNNKVCYNKGICSYDTTHNEPKCKCYSTYGGLACEKYPDDKHTFKPTSDAYLSIHYDLNSKYVHQFTYNQTGSDGDIYILNVTYDLNTMLNGIYHIKDLDGTQYDYYFNTIPDEYKEWCGDEHEGFIYEIDVHNSLCHVQGSNDIQWKLYDLSNPGRGVITRFISGDYCNKNDGYSHREFEIHWICPDDNTNIYHQLDKTNIEYAFVEEDDYDSCSYHMDIVNAYVCPRECIANATNDTDGITVCNHHGMCIADIFGGFVHCSCDHGFEGDFCSVSQEPGVPHDSSEDKNETSQSNNNVGYVVTITILSMAFVMLFGVAAFVLFKQRKQIKQLVATNYEEPMLQEDVHMKHQTLCVMMMLHVQLMSR